MKRQGLSDNYWKGSRPMRPRRILWDLLMTPLWIFVVGILGACGKGPRNR